MSTATIILAQRRVSSAHVQLAARSVSVGRVALAARSLQCRVVTAFIEAPSGRRFNSRFSSRFS